MKKSWNVGRFKVHPGRLCTKCVRRRHLVTFKRHVLDCFPNGFQNRNVYLPNSINHFVKCYQTASGSHHSTDWSVVVSGFQRVRRVHTSPKTSARVNCRLIDVASTPNRSRYHRVSISYRPTSRRPRYRYHRNGGTSERAPVKVSFLAAIVTAVNALLLMKK